MKNLKGRFIVFYTSLVLCACQSKNTSEIEYFAHTLNKCANVIVVSNPDLHMLDLNKESSQLLLKTKNYNQIFYLDDSLVVVSEIVPNKDNKLHVINYLTKGHAEFNYERLCDHDGGMTQFFHSCLDSNKELTFYWGCVDKFYKLNCINEKLALTDSSSVPVNFDETKCDDLTCSKMDTHKVLQWSDTLNNYLSFNGAVFQFEKHKAVVEDIN